MVLMMATTLMMMAATLMMMVMMMMTRSDHEFRSCDGEDDGGSWGPH